MGQCRIRLSGCLQQGGAGVKWELETTEDEDNRANAELEQALRAEVAEMQIERDRWIDARLLKALADSLADPSPDAKHD